MCGACSAGAFYKRPDGIVLIDHNKCVGAGDCVDSCPYGVIDMNPDQDYFPGQNLPYENTTETHRIHPPGKPSKCTLCIHRIEQGNEPICVEAYPSKVMIFGDLDNPGSHMQEKLDKSVPLLVPEGANPKTFYMIPLNLLKEIEKRIMDNPNMVR